MAEKIYRYFAEGECEEKLLNALKMRPSLIQPGKVEKFNVIQNEFKTRKLASLPPSCVAVLVFDSDKDETGHLKRNIELLRSWEFEVEVLTIVQVLNFEDEIERSTDLYQAQDLTRSKTVVDFKSAVNRMKETDFRSALKRHKLDMSRLWSEKPPQAFRFVKQDADKVKLED